MRRSVPLPLSALIVVALLLSILPPAAGAQGEECPEGLVYEPVGDICVLPENLPAPDEEPPIEEEPVEEEPVEDVPVEEQTAEEEPDDEAPLEGGDEGVPTDEGDGEPVDPAADAPTLAGDATQTIKNLTLLTFACPINWDPATRPIESSREMCTEPIVEGMSYSILFEGEERVAATLGVPIDLAETFGPSGPGMYTIRENLQEGLEDPFAFCAIYAADGSSRLTVQETVRGGSLDILLAAGEEVNCEWYSVATVPEVAAPPALGLDLRLFSCPAPAEFNGGLDECTLPHPGPIAFEFSYGGRVLETGTVSPPEFSYDLDKDDPSSGEWTIRPILPVGWIDPHFTCTINDISTGPFVGEATFFPPADGSLGVTVRLNPDQRSQCQVWLFAGDVRESVVVVTRDCPDDFDAATLSPGVRTATCPGSQFRPVSVTVDEAVPVLGESTRNGVAVFPTQPGLWRIAADPSFGVAGRAVTFVTCDHTLAALGQVQTIEPTINADRRSVSIELDEGDALRCDFFSGPAPAAAEAPPPAPAEEPEAETTAPEEAAVEPEAEAETTEPEAATTDVAETAPETGAFGGGAPEGDAGTGGGQTVQVVDTAAQDAAASAAVEGTASLAIQHWDCPVAIAPEATADSLLETCVASVQPSAWQLNGTALDVADGYAVWDGLPLEPAVVGNAAATGKEDAASAVHCSLALTDVDEPLIGVEAAVQGGAIELVFDQPSVVYCNWFLGP